ncbi:MAG TPA: peptidoglycan-associated lipoprotein Pal [Ramlibacter sp.]|nr:peptidoglycan-associated lipoprotein Pal [Ramlibacter sp.]
MKKRVILALAAAAVLAGCASGVKLDDVPVDDRTGAAVTPGGPGTGDASARPVQPVQADPSATSGPGPANVSRIVYFDYDSYVVKPEFQSVIDAHARYLRSNNRNVVIEGHTDERGGREYNLALGQRRSEAVRRALGLLGVPDSRIEAVSFGEEKPATQGGEESAWAQNRRAEISYR